MWQIPAATGNCSESGADLARTPRIWFRNNCAPHACTPGIIAHTRFRFGLTTEPENAMNLILILSCIASPERASQRGTLSATHLQGTMVVRIGMIISAVHGRPILKRLCVLGWLEIMMIASSGAPPSHCVYATHAQEQWQHPTPLQRGQPSHCLQDVNPGRVKF